MKKKILIPALIAILLLSISIGIFWYSHPTHYRYNDRFILGRSADEITAKYGAFDSVLQNETGEMICGIYQIREDTPELIMSYDNSLWYEIVFENGIAVSIRLQEGQRGG